MAEEFITNRNKIEFYIFPKQDTALKTLGFGPLYFNIELRVG